MDNYQKLMLVTHRQETPLSDYLKFIQQCASSGITSVQLREKDASLPFLDEFGKRLKEILDPLKVPLIVNDNVRLAKQLDAEGVHLGQQDGDPLLVRNTLGPDKIIGISLESLNDLDASNLLEGKIYVAASSVFETKNKNNLKTFWGISGLKKVVQNSKHPVIAIGGINDENIYEVLSAGAAGIAVIGTIHDSPNPGKITAKLRKVLDRRTK